LDTLGVEILLLLNIFRHGLVVLCFLFEIENFVKYSAWQSVGSFDLGYAM